MQLLCIIKLFLIEFGGKLETIKWLKLLF